MRAWAGSLDKASAHPPMVASWSRCKFQSLKAKTLASVMIRRERRFIRLRKTKTAHDKKMENIAFVDAAVDDEDLRVHGFGLVAPKA